MLAVFVLAVHVTVILFNIFGLVAIPIGAWHHWSFVRAPVWRYLHILSLGLVAVQAALGRACFLTMWQDALTGGAQAGLLADPDLGVRHRLSADLRLRAGVDLDRPATQLRSGIG
jgi:hypothetical protein